MSTTGLVMTVTDELLAELDRGVRVVWRDDDATVIAVDALTAELRRLRAENAGLAQSLAESRANDQAAMGWLTSLRWASGDRGERMLPELVAHIESLAKDSGRYRWLRDESLSCGKTAPAIMVVDEAGNPVYRGNPWNSLLCDDDADSAIDAAMDAQ